MAEGSRVDEVRCCEEEYVDLEAEFGREGEEGALGCFGSTEMEEVGES